jgi:hypothetical protein
MEKLSDYNNHKDLIANTLRELDSKGIVVNEDIIKHFLSARNVTVRNGMEEGKNIRFNFLGTITVKPAKFQRVQIRRELRTKYGDTKTKEAIEVLVRDEMKRLNKDGKLLAKQYSTIRKTTKRIKAKPINHKYNNFNITNNGCDI